MNAPLERRLQDKAFRKMIGERFATKFFNSMRSTQEVWLAILISKLPRQELEELRLQMEAADRNAKEQAL